MREPFAARFRAMLEEATAEGPEALLRLIGLCVVYRDHAQCAVSAQAAAVKAEAVHRISPKEAARRHPVSRRWIYERGEDLGFATRIEGTRKIVVDEAALLRVIGGKR